MTRQAYPEYKPSGVEWLGDVPEHWEVTKLKHVASLRFSNVDKKSHNDESPVHLCNYVDVYYNDYITAAIEFMEATATRDEITRFSLNKGDVLITKDSESWDDIAVPACIDSELQGVLCGYHLAQIRPHSSLMDGRFLFRAFAAHGICEQFKVAATGITRYGLSKDSISSSLFLVPPLLEQRAIAAFLDRETAKIDALVAKKERLIELLQEKRTALISHAVTKGLNPDTKTTDSGFPWLGRIPAHWCIMPLKVLFTFRKGKDSQRLTATYIGDNPGDYPVYSGQTENAGVMGHISTYDFEVDEVIFTTTVGARVMTPLLLMGRFSLSQNCLIMTPSDCETSARFFFFQLFPLFAFERAGIPDHMQPSLRISDLRKYRVAVPPPDEQQTIMAYLDVETAKLDTLKSTIRRGIQLLLEYRTALISAAVTGKIDVRKEVSCP